MRPPRRQAEPAESWGRYRLTEKVGEGSFGSVYRALDPDLQREIAIKILHNRVADTQLKERLPARGAPWPGCATPMSSACSVLRRTATASGSCMEFVHGATLEVRSC